MGKVDARVWNSQEVHRNHERGTMHADEFRRKSAKIRLGSGAHTKQNATQLIDSIGVAEMDSEGRFQMSV